MIISLLLAASENNVIGKDNALPWHLPRDLKYFRNQTWGMPVLMGRKTFESMGKPLPGRRNIVITRDNGWKHPGAVVVHSVEEAESVAAESDIRELFIIGGAEIFNSVLPRARRIYLTRIHETFEGDVFFPPIDESWKLTRELKCRKDEKNKYDHSYQVWER
ncbi:MAG TPA: dihydrofolate reductase [Chitinophagaceae bacterium]|jgi:dihydrofolate reductase|nr:dihydrofolate reductase [Chitinophagaceae bacterium]